MLSSGSARWPLSIKDTRWVSTPVTTQDMCWLAPKRGRRARGFSGGKRTNFCELRRRVHVGNVNIGNILLLGFGHFPPRELHDTYPGGRTDESEVNEPFGAERAPGGGSASSTKLTEHAHLGLVPDGRA